MWVSLIHLGGVLHWEEFYIGRRFFTDTPRRSFAAFIEDCALLWGWLDIFVVYHAYIQFILWKSTLELKLA